MTLTPRQLDCLRHAADGQSYAAIGERLYISETTVKIDLMRVRANLGAHNIAHAVHLAHRGGLLGTDSNGRAAVAEVLGRIAHQLGYDIALLPRGGR